jgi:D-arabinose 1-dehydrogenase-like Zn-dependent alcohol dehydrogenase
LYARKARVRALVLDRPGSPERLRWTTFDEPEPRASEVLVTVRVSGVCHHDVLARRGAFSRTRWPAVLGHEIAGTVRAVGPEVKRLAPGDRVLAATVWSCGACAACRAGDEQLCRHGRGVFGETTPGGYAELLLAPEHALLAIPDGVSDAEAAVLPCALGTAYRAVAGLSAAAGERVVVTGASGGVGLHAVAVASARGLRPIAVTGSAGKAEAIAAAGAADVVVSERGRFAGAVRELAPDGVAAVVDPTAAALGESLRCLRHGGRVVVVGNVGAAQTPIEPALLIMKELGVVASRGASRGELEKLLGLVAAGTLRPRVAPPRAPEDIPQLHHELERRQVTGKLVVAW